MALLPLLLVLVLAVVITVGVSVARRSPPSRETTVAAARRHALSTSAAALLAAPVAALVCAVVFVSQIPGPGAIGRGVLLAPVAAGVAHTVVLLVGELTWPRPQGDVRRARLVRRGVFDAAPRWLVRLAATTLAALVVVLAVGALSADHTGRRISVSLLGAGAAASPFPGAFYGAPAAVGLAVLVALTIATLRVVAERPAVATEDARIERALRRASAHRVLRGAAATALAEACGLLLAAGSSLRSIGSTGITGTVAYAAAGTALVVVAAAAGLLALLVACARAPSVPADHPVAAS